MVRRLCLGFYHFILVQRQTDDLQFSTLQKHGFGQMAVAIGEGAGREDRCLRTPEKEDEGFN